MTKTRRTKVTAPEDSIRTLNAVEPAEDKAQVLRARRRPHVGVARSVDAKSASDLTGDPVADDVH
jgi:hypothetical protein